MQDFVFFDFRPRVSWLYPIWTALNATNSDKLREARAKHGSTLGDLAIAVATKLAILRTVVDRFNSDYRKLLKLAADDTDRIVINRRTGTVWSLQDEKLPYELQQT